MTTRGNVRKAWLRSSVPSSSSSAPPSPSSSSAVQSHVSPSRPTSAVCSQTQQERGEGEDGRDRERARKRGRERAHEIEKLQSTAPLSSLLSSGRFVLQRQRVNQEKSCCANTEHCCRQSPQSLPSNIGASLTDHSPATSEFVLTQWIPIWPSFYDTDLCLCYLEEDLYWRIVVTFVVPITSESCQGQSIFKRDRSYAATWWTQMGMLLFRLSR